MPPHEQKTATRRAVYDAIQHAGVGRFPGIRGRIPNFKGSEAAAERLVSLDVFRSARTIKSNPDSPQRAVRRAALEANKTVYVAVPKLAAERPFLELDPSRIDPSDYWRASSIKGADELGRPVAVDELPNIDLIVTGCVGVTRSGARLGKGGGYADLEYGLLRQARLVTEDTPIAPSSPYSASRRAGPGAPKGTPNVVHGRCKSLREPAKFE